MLEKSRMSREAHVRFRERLGVKLPQPTRHDCFNSLDVQWREDSAPWCTRGNAILGLSLLRVMAYNLAQQLRRRRLRRKDEDGRQAEPMSWRSLFKAIGMTLETVAGGYEVIVAVG